MQSFDRSFQQGSSDEGTVLSKKTDPNVILNLAEQRVQSLFDKFAADKTVRLSPTWLQLLPHTLLLCAASWGTVQRCRANLQTEL